MLRRCLTTVARAGGGPRLKPQGPKKGLWRMTTRVIGSAALATTALTGWQYYRLRTEYRPLTPPKGAMSGIEGPSESDCKDECQILFIGDSLVIGIGCPDRAEGPVFARHISRVAAQALRRRVKWKVLGVDGGDVQTIRQSLLEDVRKAAANGQPKVTAVVIMCGLNDYKRLIQEGRLPSAFKEDLRLLIRNVKEIVGQEARVVLPALPVDRAPLFQPLFPMNVALYKVAKVWDHQKRLLSGEEQSVEFVAEPEHYDSNDWAIDGIHPSEKGYTKWADHIIKKVLPHLVKVEPHVND